VPDSPLGAPGAPPPAGLHRALLDWFAAHRRDLPWRRQRSLYGTWISEIMLQQTTVAAVVPYWERFLARYPDVGALAGAADDDVLALWSGLGYYRRARHLLAAARLVVGDLGGELPRDAAGWRSLPGVGAYAAGAIASIGLGLPEPAIDANARRVLGRWHGAAAGRSPATATAIAAAARALLPPRDAGPWNEALMELGATVCLPRRPLCASCPVATFCSSRGAGGSADAVAPGPPAQAVGVVVVVFQAAGRVWLEPAGGAPLPCATAAVPARADFHGLHPGLLGLPMTAWFPLPEAAAGRAEALAALVAGVCGLPGPRRRLGTVRHAITRYRLEAAVIALDLPEAWAGPPAPARPPGIWAEAARAPDLHVSQLTRKALRRLGSARG